MTLADIRELVLAADPDACAYESDSTGEDYTTWQPLWPMNLLVDNRYADGWHFVIDRFTRMQDDPITANIRAVLDDALAAYNAMRAVEGEKLALDVSSRVDTIEETVSKVEAQSPQTVAAYRQRLEAKMQEVLQSTTIDESRILTEAAIFADKVAVDEETVRLRSHIAQLRDMLQSGEPVGRKLDFLIQEVNRECNTIGSKCSDASLAKVGGDLKSEIEKIREQLQNVE